MNLRAIIFSKDRPLQLHGTLESFRLRCSEAAETPVSVIYCSSEPRYSAGYDQLKKEFSSTLNVEWILEKNFKTDLLGALADSSAKPPSFFARLLGRGPQPRNPFVLFLVDDNLFIRNFSLTPVAQALGSRPKALGFSLRVGRNTTYCYSNRCDQAFPDFSSVGPSILTFNWPGQQGDFGYPIEVSSSVYRTSDLLGLLRTLPYNNPNRLEQGLSVSSRLFARRLPELLCWEQSVAFCAPVNKVQTVIDNRAGSAEEYSSSALNEMFLAGRRIDVEKLHDFVPVAAHQEIELPLIQVGRN